MYFLSAVSLFLLLQLMVFYFIPFLTYVLQYLVTERNVENVDVIRYFLVTYISALFVGMCVCHMFFTFLCCFFGTIKQ
jgi:hypothetical protein